MPIQSLGVPSQEFLENLVDAVREPLVVLDDHVNVLLVSRAFYDVFGVTPSQTVGRCIFELGDGQWNIPALKDLLENVIPSKTSFYDFEVVHDFVGLGRRTMLLNARQIPRPWGRRPLVLLAIEDISCRKAEEAVAELARRNLVTVRIAEAQAREFAQGIIDTIREPLLALDHELRVVAASRAFYDVFQVTPGQTLGQRIYDLGDHQWDIPSLRELLEVLLVQSTSFNDYEVNHEFVGIGRKTMVLNARQMKARLGSSQVYLLAIEDVTEQRRFDQELLRMQRVESLGVLAGGIAHDFNNLMAGLMANTELARDYLTSGNLDAARERMDRTPAIFLRGKALTRQLLTFSKGGAPVRMPVLLGPSFAPWLDFALVGSDLVGKLTVDHQLWACNCDLGQIGQVMHNLLLNARQASPAGATVTVTATNLRKLGPFLRLTVANQGDPIPSEALGKIFDPFFSTKSEGTGLGLAVVYSIVHQHGGSVEVRSEEAGSDRPSETVFSVYLPAVPQETVVTPQSQPGEGLALVGLALVMDDDADVLDGVGAMLANLGFAVVRASDGQGVLDEVDRRSQRGESFGVFLLDSQIPGEMGGVPTALALRERGVTGRIVLMSGHFGPMVHRETSLPALPCLAKPFSQGELREALTVSIA